MDFELFMQLALLQAENSRNEVPVGAVLVSAKGELLAAAHNLREAKSDPTSHAEIEVLRTAARALGDWRLWGSTLFVTLEPCVMCAGAIVEAKVERVVFGAWREGLGAAGSLYDILRDGRLGTPIEVVPGVLSSRAGEILSQYFDKLR